MGKERRGRGKDRTQRVACWEEMSIYWDEARDGRGWRPEQVDMVVSWVISAPVLRPMGLPNRGVSPPFLECSRFRGAAGVEAPKQAAPGPRGVPPCARRAWL